MSDNKRNHRGINGRGYYIALVLCAAAIGITGYLYYQNSNPQEITVQEPMLEDVAVGTMATEAHVAALATEPQLEVMTPPAPVAEEPAQKTGLQTTAPLSGEEIWGYSMEALSYNQTTRDWRVHNGVDIAAETGSAVCAAADGQVYSIYEDDTMGMTVVIRHADGYVTTYASLDPEVAVAAGDSVKAGQKIGCAGTSAMLESAIGCHVHFGVTRDNVPVDPAEFLAQE